MEEVDLVEIFNIFWKKKIWLVVALIIGLVCGMIYTEYFVVPKYSSSVTLVLTKPVLDGETMQESINQQDVNLNQKLISTYSEIMKSRSIAGEVISRLNLKMSYGALKSSISVTAVANTDVLKVTVTTTDPTKARDIANCLTEVFCEEIVKIYNIQNISIIDSAELNITAINISLTKNVALCTILIVSFVAVIIFLLYLTNTTVKSLEEVEKIVDVPVFAVIPVIHRKEKDEDK